MSIDDEFGSGHDVENRRRRRRVDFDDDGFSDGHNSFLDEELPHLSKRHDAHNYEGRSDGPPVTKYYKDRAFGTGTSDADKGTDKPDEEPHRNRRACYQC
ncbi:hypothetical protein HY636_04505 [Candidatus Woesearchaeota archaeon]|nr:hypothetical protein [Candidatus Woesearchaeota archaeon]